jgi:hypothetical protein
MSGQGFYDNVESITLKYKYLASVPGLGVGLFALDYPLMDERTVLVFRQKCTLENVIEFHAFAPLEALPCVWPVAFLGGSLL